MVTEFSVEGLNLTTPVLLLIALGIFGWLAAQSRNFRSFQFQLSIFIVILIVGEIVDLMGEVGAIPQLSADNLAMYIHISAMGVFSVMLWARFYISRRSGRRISDSVTWT